MVEVENYVDFLLYKFDRFRSVRSGIVCRLQMNVNKEWKLLRSKFNDMKETECKDECIYEVKLVKLFKKELSDQLYAVLDLCRETIEIAEKFGKL
jgi:hypothetical protein